MKSCLTFELSTGRSVELTLAATDGRRLKAAEVFEVVRYSGRACGEFESALTAASRASAIRKVLPRIVRRSPGGAVPIARLAPLIRRQLPQLTTRQIQCALPAVMAEDFDARPTHDLPTKRGHVRGYRGIALKKPA